MKQWEPSLLMDFYAALLTPHQRNVMRLYYEEDLSLAEIAAQLGVSRQSVHDVIRRAGGQLADFEEKLRLMERFRSAEGLLDRLGVLLGQMPEGLLREEALEALAQYRRES